MVERLVVIGAGGFGREVVDVVEAINLDRAKGTGPTFEVLGFLDDGEPDESLLSAYGLTKLGPVQHLQELPDDVGYVIGIGDPRIRGKIDGVGTSLGRVSPTLVHPRATIAREVALGPGTVVCAGATLTNHITLGRQVHVNVNSTIGHDAVLDDYVTLSPMVAISGNVTAEAGSFLGTGAIVNPGVRLGAGCTVGSGAVVLSDVERGTTVVGIPARSR